MLHRLITAAVLPLHRLYYRAFTWWRVRALDAQLRQPLAADERPFLLFAQPALLGPDLVVYDIGAASGTVTACLAKLANVRAVHAFEPLPTAFAELSARVKRWAHVTCHNVAVGEQTGPMEMVVLDDARDSSSLLAISAVARREFPGAYDRAHRERVTVVALDDYVQTHGLPLPDVIKIDVQGYEDRVLRGGAATVSQARFCIVEMSFVPLYDGGPLFDEVYSQFRTLGFRLAGAGNPTGAFGASGQAVVMDCILRNTRA